MSGFSKIAGGKINGGGNFFRDGNYVLLVENVSLEKKYSGDTFIAELRVMQATPNGELDEKGNPVVPNKVGSQGSLVCLLSKHDSAADNAKSFVFGVLSTLGYTEEQITEELLTEVCDKKVQPLKGMAVEMRTRRKINQGKVNKANEGKILTLPSWYPIAQTADQIKNQRAWLAANKPGTVPGTTAATTAAAPTEAPAAAPQPAPAAPAPVVAPTPAAATSSPLAALLGGS